MQKKDENNIQPSGLNKPKDYAKIAGTKQAIPSGQDKSILPAQIAKQNTGFASSCPLPEPAIL